MSTSFAAQATSSYFSPVLGPNFPITPEIQDSVQFWERIFDTYSSDHSVIHGLEDASLVLDVVDFIKIAKAQGLSMSSTRVKQQLFESYLDRYKLALRRFKKEKEHAIRHGPIEARVWSIYKRQPFTKALLLRGESKVRGQGGLADEFLRAANRAQRYLPKMEEIFRRHQVPQVVTRLVFVESMFNINAYSKVGAAGIWQFMKATARDYMHVNRLVDERRSPLKATIAAAQFLSRSHRQLRSWPLSITSYNFGLNGMLRAVKRLNTRNFDTIIANYKSPYFRYASKNFYAEFIAASMVYARLLRSGKVSMPALDNDFTMIELKGRPSVAHLLKKIGIAEKTLREYNPCIKRIAYTTLRSRRLPRNYRIVLPSSLAKYAQERLGIRRSSAQKPANKS